MKCKLMSLLLVVCLFLAMAMPAAADSVAENAAGKLNQLGLFQGVGTRADGSQNYDLERKPSRQEAVTMLVRLLGKETEAKNGTWNLPFRDVDEWAKPYVGYAYANGLTQGMSAEHFGGNETVTATQYLTFVLRALGYVSGSDFAWDAAWEKTDALGITAGNYGPENNNGFLRADAVLVSAAALRAGINGQSQTLVERLVAEGAVTKEAAQAQGLMPDVYTDYARQLLALDGERTTLAQDEKGSFSGQEIMDMLGVDDPARTDTDLYHAKAFDGDMVGAMAWALRNYVNQCLDGNYNDGANRLGNPTYGGLSAPDLFLFTNAEGMIVAVATRTEQEQHAFDVVLLKEDSRPFVDARVAEINAIYESLPTVECQAEVVDGRYVYHFNELPDNAVWMDQIMTVWQSAWSIQQGKRPVDSTMKQKVISYQRTVLNGTLPTLPAEESYVGDKEMSDVSDGAVFHGFVFLDANHQLVAYCIVKIPVT